jgi:SAM-dependent methyltransferase
VTVTVHDAARGFEAAAATYDRSRPEYPEEAMDLVARSLGLAPGRRLLDLGAGTGKFSRLAAARGATVVALEPVEAMIRGATGAPGVLAVRGVAEALPVRPHGVDAACAASSFHWFDGRRALGEIHRALRRGGRLALVWNHRDDAVDWVARLSAIVNRHEGAAPRYRKGDWRAAFDGGRDLFRPLEEARFRHAHRLAPAGVVERVGSVSFIAALEPAAREAVLDEVRAVLASHPETAGRQELPLAYLTDVFLWERV